MFSTSGAVPGAGVSSHTVRVPAPGAVMANGVDGGEHVTGVAALGRGGGHFEQHEPAGVGDSHAHPGAGHRGGAADDAGRGEDLTRPDGLHQDGRGPRREVVPCERPIREGEAPDSAGGLAVDLEQDPDREAAEGVHDLGQAELRTGLRAEGGERARQVDDRDIVHQRRALDPGQRRDGGGEPGLLLGRRRTGQQRAEGVVDEVDVGGQGPAGDAELAVTHEVDAGAPCWASAERWGAAWSSGGWRLAAGAGPGFAGAGAGATTGLTARRWAPVVAGWRRWWAPGRSVARPPPSIPRCCTPAGREHDQDDRRRGRHPAAAARRAAAGAGHRPVVPVEPRQRERGDAKCSRSDACL